MREPGERAALVIPGRLHRHDDIRAVFAARQVRRGRHVHVYVRDGGGQHPRVAVVAGRKVGSAVRRNRAKRRIRAAVREVGMPRGRDAVVVARPDAPDAPFSRLREEVRQISGAGGLTGGARRG